MNNTWLKDKSEEMSNCCHRTDDSQSDKRLDSFIKRIQEDMAENKISEDDGNSLITLTTIVISMLTSR